MYHRLAEAYDTPGCLQFSKSVWARLEPALVSSPVQRFLNLGCGTGNLEAYLWRDGWSTVGVDRSPEMLAIARARGDRAGADARFIEADLRELRLDETFAVVGCFYDVLNHVLSTRELTTVFRNVRELLRPGGRFFFDVTTLATYLELWQDTVDFIDSDTATIIIRSRFDDELRLATANITGFLPRDGRYERRDEDVYQYCFLPDEITHCLDEAGLTLVGWDGFNPYPNFPEEPLKTWWVARRRDDLT